jgi:cardiolipin synthase
MAAIRSSKLEFPWRDGNKFSLLINGENYFPRMLDAINAARHSVRLEMYLIESGTVATRFIDALIEAAARGVVIQLLFDDYGSLGLSRYDRIRLRRENIELRYYNKLSFGKFYDNMARDHRKLLIVDAEFAFVGGAGITDAFALPDGAQSPWRETMVEIRGPVLIDWVSLFDQVWQRSGGEPANLAGTMPDPLTDGVLGRVTIANGVRSQGIMRSLIRRVYRAERRVWLGTAYFVPSWKLRRALRYAARSGADVRLLLPGTYTDHPAVRYAGRRYYATLLNHGVRIYEYQPRVLHSKALICDQWVTIGSSNFDRWNLRWNLEANQTVDDAYFTEKVVAMFERDFSDSIEITQEQWSQRPVSLRFREQFWGKIDVLLHRLGAGRHDH